MSGRGVALWALRRGVVALGFCLTAYGLDPVWPLMGVPWTGPRFLLGGAAGLATSWALAWATRPRRARRAQRAQARAQEVRAQEVRALGLRAVRQALA